MVENHTIPKIQKTKNLRQKLPHTERGRLNKKPGQKRPDVLITEIKEKKELRNFPLFEGHISSVSDYGGRWVKITIVNNGRKRTFNVQRKKILVLNTSILPMGYAKISPKNSQ
jgi:hypothetical protein